MITLLSWKRLVLELIATTAIAAGVSAQDNSAPAMTLMVDETQAARRIAFVHEEIRVQPGAAGARVSALDSGRTRADRTHSASRRAPDSFRQPALPWTRDPEEIFTIHVDVPAGAKSITVDFDTLLENTISDHQLLLAWNTVVLYPRGIDKRAADDRAVDPSARQLETGQLAAGDQPDRRTL